MPIIANQYNPWARQKGPEIQRSDLWVVDFTQAMTGLTTALTSGDLMSPGVAKPSIPPKLATYFAKSVSLPDLKIRPEAIRRDSRPYQMPSWDEPLDSVRMVFWLDCAALGGTGQSPYQSDIYQMLTAWRAVSRAGRGSLSSEYAIQLNSNYRIDYAFNVDVLLLRASTNPTVSTTAASASGTANTAAGLSITNDLEQSLQLHLVNCWLSSFKVSELSYEGAQLVQLDTTFYAEDILQ